MVKKLVALCALLFSLAPVSAGAGVKLTTVTHWDLRTGPGALLVKYVQEYNAAQDGVEVEVVQDPSAASPDRIAVWAAAGMLPDILPVSQVAFVDLMRAGIFAPLPGDAAELVRETYLEAALDMVRFEDQIWGYPSEYIPMVFTYDTVAFAHRGLPLDFPGTWPELLVAAKKLTAYSEAGAIVKAGLGWTNDQAHNAGIFLALAWTSGRPGASMFGDGRASVANPAAEFSLDFLDELFNRERVAAWGPDRTLADHAIRWTPSHHRRAIAAVPGRLEEVRSARVPAGADGARFAPAYGWAYTVPAAAEHPREAHEFLKWLAADVLPGGTTRLGNIMMELGSIPGARADLKSQEPLSREPFYSGYYESLVNGEVRTLPTQVINFRVLDVLNGAVTSVIAEGRSVAEALSEAEAQLRTVY